MLSIIILRCLLSLSILHTKSSGFFFLFFFFLKVLVSLQENREYREMTRTVDPNQIYGRENLLHGFGAVCTS